jgi:hypothetical protein
MRSRFVIAAAALSVGAVVSSQQAFGATSGPAPTPSASAPTAKPALKALYDVGVHRGTAQPAPAVAGLQIFSKTVNDGGTNFTYRMVGKDPTVAQTNPVTNVTTALVPLIIKIGTRTWNPTTVNGCDTVSALQRTIDSPIFKLKKFKFGSTLVGKAQYVDAYQRANFWTSTNPAGINPGYHSKLKLNVRPAITVTVPAGKGVLEGSTPCGFLAGVDIDWLDNLIQGTLLPQLAAQGFGPTTFPLFLVDNVVEYITVAANCCVLGYHNSTSSASNSQTYSVSMYDNSSSFSGVDDIAVLTHEVAEWLDDPFTDNPTKPWGHVGQVSGCQSNLENGDPLSGTIKPVPLGGYTYHVQELAFVSWFYHQNPSTGVNGWYSNYGKFRSPAAPCS